MIRPAPLPDPAADALDRAYLVAAARGLAREIDDARSRGRIAPDPAPSAFADRIAAMGEEAVGASWEALWDDLDAAGGRLAAALNAGTSYAREYASMEEFFADAERQRHGHSDHTFWDTYEHGRRRQLERIFADCRGHDGALLLNSGMSAIAVALETAGLRPGDSILTGRNAYFETAQLLDAYAARGVEVRKVDLADQLGWTRSVRAGPSVVLVETVENGPAGQPCPDPRTWLAQAAARLVLVDNSIQATHVDWAAIARDAGQAETLVVAESCAKYLTQAVVAGVIFGTVDAVERCRAVARNHGQHLQQGLFNQVRVWEMRELATRLALHARNARRFHDRLRQGRARDLPMFRLVDAAGRGDWPFDTGVGALLYCRLGDVGDGRTPAARHRVFLDAWTRFARVAGCPVAIRAGFGWRQTAARCYEGQYLNQAQAPDYIRVSLGIEPVARIDAIATAFDHALAALMEGSA